MIFKRTHVANRGTATYKSDEGLVIYAPKSVGDQPVEILVEGLTAPEKSAAAGRAKLTPEQKAENKRQRDAEAAERKARNAGLTPAQRAAERVQRLEQATAAAKAKADKIAEAQKKKAAA